MLLYTFGCTLGPALQTGIRWTVIQLDPTSLLIFLFFLLLQTYSFVSKFRIWCSRSAWFGFRHHVSRLRLPFKGFLFFCACRPADEQAIASPDRGLLHVWCSAGCSPERVLLSTPALQVALGEHHGLLLAQGVFVW